MSDVFGKPSQVTVGDDITETLSPKFSEDELALRFTRLHGNDLRYVAKWNRWMHYTGERWAEDDTLHVFDRARAICRVASIELAEEKPGLAKHLTAASTVAAVERLARADRKHAATADQWDADPWLLNTPVGVIDLKTGNIQSSLREDYCSRITAVAPGDHPTLWFKFLARVTGDDQELQSFYQRVAGYALTGITTEHALFFGYGTGANGKSTFLNAISGAMGSYAVTAPVETFTASQGERHSTDVAGLRGARLVTATETEEGRHWAEAKIKQITGGDRIAARFMRQDYFEFTPQFKLIVCGNHKPRLRNVDEAIRRRFYMLPFTKVIPAEERDIELSEKLRAEWPGILNWAIDGCVAWQAERLNAPPAVRIATESYLVEEDVFQQFIEECCVTGPRFTARSSDLYTAYCRWCETTNEKAASGKRFSQTLAERGFVKEHTMVGTVFTGIGSKAEGEN